ncbi:hypothetical protein F4809DRAFT_509296 [Biscogniauxia mediterranea]|nr:hypothetical protein F4809DRAFT_509296 [Biscogniauxia mediterranea]
MPLTQPIINIALTTKGCVRPDQFLHNWIRAKEDPVADNTTIILVKALQDLLCDVNKKQQGSTDDANIDPSLTGLDNKSSTKTPQDAANIGPEHIEFYFNQDSRHEFIRLDLSLCLSTSNASPEGWDAIRDPGWVSTPGLKLKHVGDPRICCMKPSDVVSSGLEPQPSQWSGGSFTEGPWIQGTNTPITPSLDSYVANSISHRGRPTRGRGRGRAAKANRGRGGNTRADISTRRQGKQETRKNGIFANAEHQVKLEPTIDMSQAFISPYGPYQAPYMGDHMGLALRDTLPHLPDDEELQAVNLGI